MLLGWKLIGKLPLKNLSLRILFGPMNEILEALVHKLTVHNGC